MELGKRRIRGDAFMRLLGWELRQFRGRRPGAEWLLWAPVYLAIPVISWWIADQPEREPGPGWIVHNAALGLLVLTPLHDEIARLGQMTFSYRPLRFTVDLLVGFTRLALPAVAAAGVVRDRHSGRLAELQLTGLSSFQIYMAKSLAAALWFLIPAFGILVLFSGVLLLDAAPAGEVARLSLECAGAVLLTAMVSVASAAASRSVGAALLNVYSLLWIAVPLYWLLLLFLMSVLMGVSRMRAYPYYQLPPGIEVRYPLVCAAQAVFTAAVCVLALRAGVKRLDPRGPSRRVRDRLGSGIRWLARLPAAVRQRFRRRRVERVG
jgi:hypothetical protein